MTTEHRVVLESSHAMAALPDNSAQLVVTSPPYPMIEMWDASFAAMNPEIGERLRRGDGRSAFCLMHDLLDRVWAECYRVVQPGGFVCINVGDATRKVIDNFRLYTNHSRITSFCESLGFQSLPAILWRKQTNAPNKFMGSGMLPSGAYVTLEHEYVLVFRKGDKRVAADWPAEERSSSAYFWEERNTWFSDIWDFKGTRQSLLRGETRERSGAYPFELAYRLVNMYSMYGDTVLDPFLGTGTTTAACLTSARNSVGYEIDSTLSDVVREGVAAAARSANSVVADRLASHVAFVAAQEAKRGAPLGYTSEVYGFRVMTRQEVKLRLYWLGSIEADGRGGFKAAHLLAEPDSRAARVNIGGDGSTAEDQLALSFGG